MKYQPSVAKYKVKKDGPWYIIYDISIIGITNIIDTTCTFWGAKRVIKKHIKSKKEEPTNYYFTKDGALINE